MADADHKVELLALPLNGGLGLVERLRQRREFLSLDRVHWYMSGDPDGDCQEAADELERMRATIAECGLALQRARVQQEAAVAAERERCAKLETAIQEALKQARAYPWASGTFILTLEEALRHNKN